MMLEKNQESSFEFSKFCAVSIKVGADVTSRFPLQTLQHRFRQKKTFEDSLVGISKAAACDGQS